MSQWTLVPLIFRLCPMFVYVLHAVFSYFARAPLEIVTHPFHCPVTCVTHLNFNRYAKTDFQKALHIYTKVIPPSVFKRPDFIKLVLSEDANKSAATVMGKHNLTSWRLGAQRPHFSSLKSGRDLGILSSPLSLVETLERLASTNLPTRYPPPNNNNNKNTHRQASPNATGAKRVNLQNLHLCF